MTNGVVVQESDIDVGSNNDQVFPGEIYLSSLNAVFIEFSVGNLLKKEMAQFVPGKFYVNGISNFLDLVTSETLMRTLLPEGFSVKFRLSKLKSPAQYVFYKERNNRKFFVDNELSERDAETLDFKERRAVNYTTSLLWVGSEPELENPCNDITQFNELIAKLTEKILQTTQDEVSVLSHHWFMVYYLGPKARPKLNFSDNGDRSQRVIGIVKQLLMPHGGLIHTEEFGDVYFHRSRVLFNNSKLGYCDDLREVLKVSDRVFLDVVFNNGIIHESPTVYVAYYVFKDSTFIPSGIEINSNLGNNVRVVELFESPSGSFNSGIGVVLPSSSNNEEKTGDFVRFEAENLCCYGFNLKDIDLHYLIDVGDEFYCELKPLKEEGRCKWSCQIGHFHKNSPDMLPSVFNSSKWSFKTLENILLGRVQIPRSSSLPGPNFFWGIICYLEPGKANETVNKGLIKIANGPHKEMTIPFDRSLCVLYGKNLENTDLLFIFRQNDKVVVELNEDELKVKKVFIEEVEEKSNTNFIRWMDNHGLTFKELERVLNGSAPQRYYIPFPRDRLKARVIKFDPTKGKYGTTSGILKVDSGWSLNEEELNSKDKGLVNMSGLSVTFHRSNFWIFGRKMGKADLSYVVPKNQEVNVEIKLITSEDREKHPSLPTEIKYKATIVWVGPQRPTNERSVKSNEIFGWLKQRNMNIATFNDLVNGLLRPHGPYDLDSDNFFLPDLKDDLPVLKHGHSLAVMLEAAINCTGPNDPTIFNLIPNDDLAQSAHHISQALQHALKYYRQKSNVAFSAPPPCFNNFAGGGGNIGGGLGPSPKRSKRRGLY